MSSANTSTQLSDFIASLTQGLNAQSDKNALWLKQRQSLAMATTLLRRKELQDNHKAIRHVVVVGPTQVGKSTIVNHLAGMECAGVNALAGYTRHAQGFSSHPVDSESLANSMFPDWQLLGRDQLDSNNSKQLSIEALPENNNDQTTIYWDTPDFDSVSSRTYRSVVPGISGFADSLVLAVSKEKYADQSVWDFLEMIAPLNMPLVICINKAEQNAAAEMQNEIRTRLKTMNASCLEIVTLPWRAADQNDDTNSDARQLRALVEDQLANLKNNHEPDIASYFKYHWPVWLQAVKAEHQAANEWHEKINVAMTKLRDYYQQHYLNQNQYSEALQRSITKLLELLEIPVLAGTLGSLRKVITWPVRTIGGAIFNSAVNTTKKSSQSNESAILTEALANTLLNLQSEVQQAGSSADPEQNIWWQALNTQFQSRREDIKNSATTLIEELQPNFEPEIEAAANRLYEDLQKQPATLNSLRAARVTTDAAALVLALHTGGLSASDLVLAPALLSLTSLLAESAVGQHVKVIEKELKEKQAKQVEQLLINQILREKLSTLPNGLQHQNLYNISPERLAEAEKSLGTIS